MLQTNTQGFRLQDPEVGDVVRTAKELEGGFVEPDTSLSAEENVELLLRATRLLQLGLEVQYTEGQALLTENNDLRGDVRVRVLRKQCVGARCFINRQGTTCGAASSRGGTQCQQRATSMLLHAKLCVEWNCTRCRPCEVQELEDQNRTLEAEVGELRELRDQEALSGDVKELELELKVTHAWW